MDTADTGDTGQHNTEPPHSWNDGHDHVSASQLASESGGLSCNSIPIKPIIGMLGVIVLILFMRQFDKRTNYY